MRDTTVSPFGQQLRHWRARSGVSQLDLAAQAGTTPRHLSFIETGRSRPGAELVLRLASALDVPIRDRNALLVAAGLPPAYPALALEDDAMKPVRNVLDRRSSPATAHTAQGRSPRRRGSRPGSGSRDSPPTPETARASSRSDLWFGPGPFRHLVENWQDVVWAGVAALRREAARAFDPSLSELVKRAEGHAKSLAPPEVDARPNLPVVCPRLNLGGRRVRTISTVMRFDTAIEVTASELRGELMFPADDESERYFRELAASPVTPTSGR